ncbi:hypothetical protein G5714_009701 [Onychostoma macrolepis]|uniref:Uncharacterized protein n=1 Tax=Onychostoma macrolepis TaxID=369639 RepID=A0A7J6CSY6_9TELE|nr:hypothetical protein G5714_009701 [Onychostoma macrolepis]
MDYVHLGSSLPMPCPSRGQYDTGAVYLDYVLDSSLTREQSPYTVGQYDTGAVYLDYVLDSSLPIRWSSLPGEQPTSGAAYQRSSLPAEQPTSGAAYLDYVLGSSLTREQSIWTMSI